MNILIINTINKLYNEANLSQDNYLSLGKQPITPPKISGNYWFISKL